MGHSVLRPTQYTVTVTGEAVVVTDVLISSDIVTDDDGVCVTFVYVYWILAEASLIPFCYACTSDTNCFELCISLIRSNFLRTNLLRTNVLVFKSCLAMNMMYLITFQFQRAIIKRTLDL